MKHILLLLLVLCSLGCLPDAQKERKFKLRIVMTKQISEQLKGKIPPSLSEFMFPYENAACPGNFFVPVVTISRLDMPKLLFNIPPSNDYRDDILSLLGGNKTKETITNEIRKVIDTLTLPDDFNLSAQINNLTQKLIDYLNANQSKKIYLFQPEKLEGQDKYVSISKNIFKFTNLKHLQQMLSEDLAVQLCPDKSEEMNEWIIIYNPSDSQYSHDEKEDSHKTKYPIKKNNDQSSAMGIVKNIQEQVRKSTSARKDLEKRISFTLNDAIKVDYEELNRLKDSLTILKQQTEYYLVMTKNLEQEVSRQKESNNILSSEIASLKVEIDEQRKSYDYIVDNLIKVTKEINTAYYYIATLDQAIKDSLVTIKRFLIFRTGIELVKNYSQLAIKWDSIDISQTKLMIGKGIKEDDVEILSPHHKISTSLFRMVHEENNSLSLLILDPKKFWDAKHLVIIIE